MVRLVYAILISLPIAIYYLIKIEYISKHLELYSLEERYKIVQKMVQILKRRGRIVTKAFGMENLPEEGGYVMYPNHQGKYDVLGILDSHKSPCSFVIDEQRSHFPVVTQVVEMLEAKRLDKTDLRKQVKTILDIIEKVKSGARYIIFPEGGYEDNNNDVHDFSPGTFKCSIKSKTPIVPVVLVDSYKVFGTNSIRKVKTEVHYLKPLFYDEYKDMTSAEIANRVHSLIIDKMREKNIA